MDIVEPVQLGLGRLRDAGMMRSAGIVDEKVEPLGAQLGERAAHALGEVGEAGGMTGVELQGDGALPGLGDQSDDDLGLGGAAVVSEDGVDAALGEAEHGVAAEAAAAAVTRAILRSACVWSSMMNCLPVCPIRPAHGRGGGRFKAADI